MMLTRNKENEKQKPNNIGMSKTAGNEQITNNELRQNDN